MITIDYSLIIVMLNFVFLLIVLNSILYKPIKKFLTERQHKIAADLEQAEVSKQEAEELLNRQQTEFKESALEIRKLKEKAKKDADLLSEDIISEARNREKTILMDVEKQLIQEKKKALSEVESTLSETIVMLTSKIIGKNIDQDIDAELIKKLLRE